MKQKKHIPQRTCVGCREVLSKFSLIRVVRTDSGVEVDPTSKLAGRGAYLHANQSCWELGLNGSLEKALKIKLTEGDFKKLEQYSSNLPKRSLVAE